MHRLIMVATLLVAGFVGLRSASVAQVSAHAATTTHATVASVFIPCGAVTAGC